MGLLTWLFGKPLTPTQLVRKNQRAINKAIRNLDRERFKMEQQEKKLIVDVKNSAKAGQMDAVKIMANDLVRTRNYIKKFMMMKANLQGVSVKMLTLQSQQAIGEAMLQVTIALRGMNMQLRLPQVQRILMEFEKQSQVMDIKEEMMNDAMEETVLEGDEETETDDIVAQVLDELGLQLKDQLPELPGGKGIQTSNQRGAKTSVSADSKYNGINDSIDDDLQKRLDNLRRD